MEMRGSKSRGGTARASDQDANQEAEVGEIWQVLRIVLSGYSVSLPVMTLGKEES